MRALLLVLAVIWSGAWTSRAAEPVPIREWEGRHREDVIADLGPPSKIKHKAGREVFVYREIVPCNINTGAVTSKEGGSDVASAPPIAHVAANPSEYAEGPLLTPRVTVTEQSARIKWSKTKLIVHIGPAGRVEKALMSIPRKERDCKGPAQLMEDPSDEGGNGAPSD